MGKAAFVLESRSAGHEDRGVFGKQGGVFLQPRKLNQFFGQPESSYYRSVRVDGTCPYDRHTNRGEMGHSPKAPKTSSGGRLLKRYRDLHFSNKSRLMGSLDVIGGYSGSRLGFFRENVPSGMIGLPNEDVRNHPPCRMRYDWVSLNFTPKMEWDSIGNDNTISFLLNDDDEFILAFTLMFRLESMSHSW
ncbi:hypothetical protein VNO80_07280 [Phaseolus coccineus]|uniref:Uncharacterized protein n=1 Tax=Phaseolus coccineus TaxID=3886 RepID=A0AAN9NIN1_PHACN